jgi:hypothetical protein
VLWLRSSPTTKRVIDPPGKSQRNHIITARIHTAWSRGCHFDRKVRLHPVYDTRAIADELFTLAIGPFCVFLFDRWDRSAVLPLQPGIRGVAWFNTTSEFHRRQREARSDIQEGQHLYPTASRYWSDNVRYDLACAEPYSGKNEHVEPVTKRHISPPSDIKSHGFWH